jgi:hypothetical protein
VSEEVDFGSRSFNDTFEWHLRRCSGGKLVSRPHDLARDGGGVDSDRAEEELRLNAAAIYSPQALFVRLYSPQIPGLSEGFRSLVDSGSTHGFIDSIFVQHHGISTFSIPPKTLRLLDGSSRSVISSAVKLDLRMDSGETFEYSLFYTSLDQACSAVLGHDWLVRHNPLVDWTAGLLTFRTPVNDDLASPVLQAPSPALSAQSPSAPALSPQAPSVAASPPPSPSGSDSSPTPPSVALISAAAFAIAAKLPGSKTFELSLAEAISGRSSTVEGTPDLSGFPEEYRDYADIFNKASSETLAPHRPYNLKINLEDGTAPPLGPIYPLSQPELEAMRKFIDENLSTGFIKSSKSAHGAPVLFVRKKSGKLRLCVDYWGLNRITRKDRYPLLLISDLLDAARKARIYTKIDLRHAYHLVRIAEGNEWKTVFRTRYSSFEWRVMPFGLSNAPAAFQRFMNNIFSDLLDVNVIVYLDDILIYSDDPAAHRSHVREVLQRLRKHGLYTGPEKCLFSVDTVKYLGYILSPSGLTMDSAKIQIIQDWPEPRKVKDVQAFLGFANFYRWFIWNYSEIVILLTRLTRKNVPWLFSEDCRKAFSTLKEAFTTAPVLTHYVPDARITVETDTSDYAISGILSIDCPDKEIRPIAFYSRTLTGAELNYDTHDKELLAIFEAFQQWRHYLEGSGSPVDVVTDHKNLEYFATTKMLTRRQARWSEYLLQFNLIIRFRPGHLRAKPDALTRRWDVYPKEGIVATPA